jgi:tetratricopeptide (TPR) repeat protein
MTQSDLSNAEEAVKYFRKAHQIVPKSPIILLQLGGSLVSANRIHEGMIYLHEVLSIDPNLAEAYLMLAGGHLGLKEYDKAAKFFEKGMQLNPSDARFSYGLGLVSDKNRDF